VTRRRSLATLIAHRTGAAAVEFALAMPMLLVVITASLEMAQAFYIKTVLQAEVSAAGRNSSLQSGVANQSAIDARLSRLIHTVMPKATVTISRRSYQDFTQVGDPEDFTDLNGNGRHDSGECFIDMNGNGAWDDDLGKGDQGGANDVAVYTATVVYPQWFGFTKFIGLPETQTMHATTLLKNQPYATQTVRNGVKICA
jgi:hypothetical protein